jgi:hypothetical protein
MDIMDAIASGVKWLGGRAAPVDRGTHRKISRMPRLRFCPGLIFHDRGPDTTQEHPTNTQGRNRLRPASCLVPAARRNRPRTIVAQPWGAPRSGLLSDHRPARDEVDHAPSARLGTGMTLFVAPRGSPPRKLARFLTFLVARIMLRARVMAHGTTTRARILRSWTVPPALFFARDDGAFVALWGIWVALLALVTSVLLGWASGALGLRCRGVRQHCDHRAAV